MSDRYRIADSDNRGEHARLTRPILVLITVLIQSVIATRVTRDDKLPDKLSGFSALLSSFSLYLSFSLSLSLLFVSSLLPSFVSTFSLLLFPLGLPKGETLSTVKHVVARDTRSALCSFTRISAA